MLSSARGRSDEALLNTRAVPVRSGAPLVVGVSQVVLTVQYIFSPGGTGQTEDAFRNKNGSSNYQR